MKPQDLLDMKGFARLTGKSKGAIYQWKRASSFPFRIYKTREGLDSVSRAAVLDWTCRACCPDIRDVSRTAIIPSTCS